jgi:hypothetical protein
LGFSAHAALALASLSVLLGACASSGIEAGRDRTSNAVTGSIPQWAGGEPANVPPRPAVPPGYSAVNAPVAAREAPALTAEEQQKAIAELVAVRNRTQAQARAAREQEDVASDEGLALARGKYAGETPPRNN